MNRIKRRITIRWIIVLFILLICFSSIIGAIFCGWIYEVNPVYELPASLSSIFEPIAGCVTLIIWAISPFYAANQIFGFVRIFPKNKTFSELLWKWIGYHGVPSLSFKIFSLISLLILLASLMDPAYLAWLFTYSLQQSYNIPFLIIILHPLAISEIGIACTAFVILKKLCVEIFRLIKPAKGVINEPAVSK